LSVWSHGRRSVGTCARVTSVEPARTASTNTGNTTRLLRRTPNLPLDYRMESISTPTAAFPFEQPVASRERRAVYCARSGTCPGATESSEVRFDPGAVQQL